MRAHVVCDLGFGDCGKGLLTDHLVRATKATVVVRYNGGAQAGHNVVAPDGRHHTFAQFGSGTFAGARTFLSRHVVVHPTALLVEARVLEARGVADPLALIRVSDRARIITPYHQALNRLRELARGASRHGSCGVGVGETMRHALEHPDEAVLAGHLGEGGALGARLARVRERLREHAAALMDGVSPSANLDRERAVFEDDTIAGRWIELVTELSRRDVVVPESTLGSWLERAGEAVFEGAQGVLLDAQRGFFPHVTWADCTFANAIELLAEHAPGATVVRLGVLRSHAVRHGDGPLPTETRELDAAVREHNRSNAWQGAVRHGWFDAVLARHALDLVGGVDLLALTHLDVMDRAGSTRLCLAYDVRDAGGAARRLMRLPVEATTSLSAQAELGRLLFRAMPVLESVDTGDRLVSRIEELLGRPVDLGSRGPGSHDVIHLSRHDEWCGYPVRRVIFSAPTPQPDRLDDPDSGADSGQSHGLEREGTDPQRRQPIQRGP